MSKEKYYKILFKFFDEDLDEEIEESIWALKEGKFYKIDNIPFYAYLYSTDDIVEVRNENGKLIVDKLVKPSGNSTLRIIFDDEKELFRIKEELTFFNCDSEVNRRNKLLAVNVPKSTDYKVVVGFLDNINSLEYEEACISEFHRNQ